MNLQRRDNRYCKRIIRKHSKSFYLAFRGLPQKKRNAVYAVYAFCRTLDDTVDIEGNNRNFEQIILQWQVFTEGTVPDHPMWRALHRAFQDFPLEREPFEDMIRGQRADLTFQQPENDGELLDYCYLVAGTVGRMLLPILATENAGRLRETAIWLGQAMQLTNILRDVGEDVEKGRIYFSGEAMRQYHVLLIDFFNILPEKNFIMLWEHYAEMAEDLYRRTLGELKLFDSDSRAAVYRSALFYSGILKKIRDEGYVCLQKRVSLSFIEKVSLMLHKEEAG